MWRRDSAWYRQCQDCGTQGSSGKVSLGSGAKHRQRKEPQTMDGLRTNKPDRLQISRNTANGMRLQSLAFVFCIAVAILFFAAPLSAQVSIATASLPGGTVGAGYSQSVSAAGGSQPYTWSVSSGALPNGLSLNAGTGAITGTPTTVESPSFTIHVVDNASASDSK